MGVINATLSSLWEVVGGILKPKVNNEIHIGDSLSYTKIETDGTMEAVGDATLWEDLRVHPNSLPELGANSPTHTIVANDGNSTTGGNSIGLNGTTQYGYLADNAEIDAVDDASWSFWIKPAGDGTILFREDYIHLTKSGASLVISFDNSWDLWVNNVFVNGGNHHVAISIEKAGTSSRIIVYVNGVEKENRTVWGTALTAQTSPYYIGKDNASDYIEAHIDELHMYNVPLTAAEMLELYNSGDGTTGVPSTVNSSTDLVFRFHFDNPDEIDNDSTLGSGHDLTLYNSPTNEDSLIVVSGATGSFGVVALSFPADVISEIFFTAQVPHAYKEGTDFHPHVHWANPSTETGNVVWSLEYIWVNMNAAMTSTSLSTVTVAAGVQKIHTMTNLSTMNGKGKGISSIMLCRLYRDGTNTADTLNSAVFLSEFDFHYEVNMMGSRGIATK